MSTGVTRQFVAAELNISASWTVGYSTTCTSPKLNRGESWSAYPVGDRYRYRIKTQKVTGWTVYSPTYSTYRYAFDPRRNDIYCK